MTVCLTSSARRLGWRRPRHKAANFASPCRRTAALRCFRVTALRQLRPRTSQSRYSIIWRINHAKRPDTRARRIAKYLDMIRRGQAIR
ncbi:YdeI/OmpD-associated family protein [Conexibacter sp. S30A1]|uniref:YdeI/OmpD-associated family protein n=1 Tax=Conexibacter sp. S30A1 TaxID=2937800 RepID=UPI003530852C